MLEEDDALATEAAGEEDENGAGDEGGAWASGLDGFADLIDRKISVGFINGNDISYLVVSCKGMSPAGAEKAAALKVIIRRYKDYEMMEPFSSAVHTFLGLFSSSAG